MRIILGFMLWAALAAHAQWDNKPLPAGAGAVVPYDTPSGRVLFAPGNDYAQPALYRSSDQGATWQAAALDSPLLKLFTRPDSNGFLRLDGDLFAIHLVGGAYFSGFNCEMRRSVDAGATWS
ncbi:MAG: sialidase family protein, partial [Betaproteobacteria bacterium]